MSLCIHNYFIFFTFDKIPFMTKKVKKWKIICVCVIVICLVLRFVGLRFVIVLRFVGLSMLWFHYGNSIMVSGFGDIQLNYLYIPNNI